jgi:Zn-dependent protease
LDFIFISRLFTSPMTFFMVALTVVFSVCFHEYFHAQVALWEGDSTAADEGHLTLNPLKQMGIISVVMFCLIGICWGAVPVNPKNFRSRWSDLRVSLAGPFANFLLFALAWLAYGHITAHFDSSSPVGDFLKARGLFTGAISFLFVFGVTNFVLMLLNLIPAPGLDGWNVLRSLVPSLATTQSEAAKGFLIFVIVAVLLFIDYFYLAGKFAMAISTQVMF